LLTPPGESLDSLENGLRSSGNKDITVQVLPGINHALYACRSGALSQLPGEGSGVSIMVLNAITDWLRSQGIGT